VSAQEEDFSPLAFARSMGAPLFSADGTNVDGRFGFNSGIVGIPNLTDHADTLRKIPETMKRLKSAQPRPDVSHLDQPVANYVAAKTAPFDLELLTPFVRYCRYNRLCGGDSERGFVHFWGAGNPEQKIAAMRRYLDERKSA
jgi:hypothetical protein